MLTRFGCLFFFKCYIFVGLGKTLIWFFEVLLYLANISSDLSFNIFLLDLIVVLLIYIQHLNTWYTPTYTPKSDDVLYEPIIVQYYLKKNLLKMF